MTERYLAVRMETADMAPRVKPGEVVIYDTQGTPQADDDVVIDLPNGSLIVRGLIEIMDGAYRIERFAPPLVTDVPKAKIAAIYPVVARARPSFWQEIEDAKRR